MGNIETRPNWKFQLVMLTILGFSYSSASGQEKKVDAVDRIQLKNGATIQGRIVEEKKQDGRISLVVQLKSGGVISLDKSKLVQRVKAYDSLDAQFDRQMATAKQDDPRDFWKIVEWCEAQPSGKSRFKNERQFLFEKILLLDPNDKLARTRLGYELRNGQWVLQKVWYESHGYQKQGRTWLSNLPSEFLTQRVSEEELQLRRSKINQWLRSHEKVQVIPEEARAELLSMADELTVSILHKRLMEAAEDKKLLPQRRVFMEAFGKIPNADSIRALCYLAVNDPDHDIRERALTLLIQPGFDREMAAAMVSGYLRAQELEQLDRAAYVVGELGTSGQLMSLVRALETKQKVQINPGGERTNLMNQGGNVGMQTPSKPIFVDQLVRSDNSLVALRKITKMDFGFDKAAWTHWYIQNYTLHDAQVRTDD